MLKLKVKTMNTEQNSDKSEKALHIGRVSHSRIIGKTHTMVMGIKAIIDKGGEAAVIGCKDPQPILDQLKALGTTAKAEPMIATQPLKSIYDGFEGYIIGFTSGDKKQVGFVFY